MCVRLATGGVRGEGHLDIATAFGAGFRGTFREVIEGGGHRVRRVFSGFTDGNTDKSHRHSRGNSCVVSVTAGDGDTDTGTPSPIAKLLNFATQNYFLLGMCFAVFAAYLHPDFGANGGPLKPEITVSKLAVRVMFLISGLSLPLTELRAAVANVKAKGFDKIQHWATDDFNGVGRVFCLKKQHIAPTLGGFYILHFYIFNIHLP